LAQSLVFRAKSYQEFIRDTIRKMPNNGRGELLRLASHIEIHTSTLSQILADKKHLTLEQAALAADFFGLNDLESKCFILLVSRDRAGTQLLKKRYDSELKEVRAEGLELKAIIPQDRPLCEEQKAVFYSNWYYTALWAQTSIEGFQTREALQKHFHLPRKLVNEVVEFLLKASLCVEKAGKLAPGHQYSHLGADSPLVSRHHSNWRIKAMERHPNLSASEVCYSSPMTLSKSDAEVVKSLIAEMIAEVNRVRDPSPCEELFCLNIDWIKIDPA
jgi:hypothetical protein